MRLSTAIRQSLQSNVAQFEASATKERATTKPSSLANASHSHSLASFDPRLKNNTSANPVINNARRPMEENIQEKLLAVAELCKQQSTSDRSRGQRTLVVARRRGPYQTSLVSRRGEGAFASGRDCRMKNVTRAVSPRGMQRPTIVPRGGRALHLGTEMTGGFESCFRRWRRIRPELGMRVMNSIGPVSVMPIIAK